MNALPDPETLLTAYRLSPGFYTERLEANVYAVSAFQGEFVLKIYPAGMSLDGQRYEHWLLLALAPHVRSFALPVPVRTYSGATFYTAPNHSTWVLAPRLFGMPMQPNDPDSAYETGRALGELHRALATLQALPNPQYPHYDLNQRVLPHLLGRLPDHPADLGLQDTPEAHYRMQRFCQSARSLCSPPLPPSALLPWHIVHGDFSAAHVRSDGEGVCGVLDFSTAHPDYRMREFADTLLRVANDFGPLFWVTARAFAEGYQEYLSLTRVELDLLPRFWAERLVDSVLMFCQQRQPVHAAQALRSQEEVSTWLESEAPRLLAMLRGVFLGE